MATDWSEEAKAKRSASAKKAAETRKANQQRRQTSEIVKKHVRNVLDRSGLNTSYPYITNSRVARWALSNVSALAMMRCLPKFGWNRSLTPYPWN